MGHTFGFRASLSHDVATSSVCVKHDKGRPTPYPHRPEHAADEERSIMVSQNNGDSRVSDDWSNQVRDESFELASATLVMGAYDPPNIPNIWLCS